MRAFDLSMALICFNAGIYITNAIGCFGDMSTVTGIFPQLLFLTDPIINIAGIELKGIDLIAGALAGGTIVIVNTNAINDRGIAYTAFAVVFWGSFIISSVVLTKIPFPGIEMFYTVFFLISILIFVIALIQMPTGGQKAHV